jgi:micrococcal nuclease
MDRQLLVVLLATFVGLAGCTTALPETSPDVVDGGDGDLVVAPEAGFTPTGNKSMMVTVTRVVDGDTMKISYQNGTEDTVRLLGVDTPEVHTENSPAEFDGIRKTEAGHECLRHYGEQASQFAKETLMGETVRLQFDPDSDRRGYYGRILGYLLINGQNFNYRLVAEGHARVYDSSFSLNNEFDRAERSAQSAGTGLWSCVDGLTSSSA